MKHFSELNLQSKALVKEPQGPAKTTANDKTITVMAAQVTRM